MKNRVIKFRAWYCNKITNDEEAKRLLYNNSSKSKAFHTDAILMQFTGLLDKNGKEIYESDIVKRFPSDTGAVVILHEKYACFDFEEQSSYVFGQQNASIMYEVIGNIYSNPELLK